MWVDFFSYLYEVTSQLHSYIGIFRGCIEKHRYPYFSPGSSDFVHLQWYLDISALKKKSPNDFDLEPVLRTKVFDSTQVVSHDGKVLTLKSYKFDSKFRFCHILTV